jgi:hypothetical protein
MKKTAAYLLLFAFLQCTAMSFADEISLTVLNKTGAGIKEVYVCEPGTDKWGENLLPAEGLPDGTSAEVKLTSVNNAEYWDLMILINEDTTRRWDQLKLKGKTSLTLFVRDSVLAIKLE